MNRPTVVAFALLVVMAALPVAGSAQYGGRRGGMGRGGMGRPPMGPGMIDTTVHPGGRDSGYTEPPTPEDARVAQRDFEAYRRWRMKEVNIGRGAGECDETIGQFCYWYDPKAPPPASGGSRGSACATSST
ncbi:MAG: hypothetical protein HY275_04940 [Gemmatimonadetes bacterium]|nr:hypothetical protein [Gemmatimonadota bacterium]